MTIAFFDNPKKFFSDAYNEAKPSMLTFSGFPLFLLANEALLTEVGITDRWQSVAIQMALFALYALVMHTLGKSLFGSTPKGYEKLSNEPEPSTSNNAHNGTLRS